MAETRFIIEATGDVNFECVKVIKVWSVQEEGLTEDEIVATVEVFSENKNKYGVFGNTFNSKGREYTYQINFKDKDRPEFTYMVKEMTEAENDEWSKKLAEESLERICVTKLSDSHLN